MARDQRTRGVTIRVVVAVVFGLFGLVVGLGPLGDNSFLWHLRTGTWILDHGVPYSDPFSFTAVDVPWVAQSWLVELLYGVLDELLGAWAIRVYVGLLAAFVSVGLFLIAAKISRSTLRGAAIALPGLFCAALVWNERPLMTGVVLFLVVVAVVELRGSWLHRQALWIIPVVTWIWVNAHGTWILGVAYISLHLLGSWLDGERPWLVPQRAVLLGLVLGLTLALVNPYGIRLLLFPLDLVGRGEVLSAVIEWQSPSAKSVSGLALASWVAILVWSLARGPVRPSRRDLLVSLVFVGLSFWAVRNVVLLPLATVPVIARAWSLDVRSGTEERSRVFAYVAALLLALGALMMIVRLAEPTFEMDPYPTATFDEFDARGDVGRTLLTTDGWSGYAIWRWGAAQPVFIDDRYDMYPVEVSREYVALLRGTNDWQEILDERRVDVVIWPSERVLSSQLAGDAAWRELPTEDPRVRVFERRN